MTPDPRLAALRATLFDRRGSGRDYVTITREEAKELESALDALAAAEGEAAEERKWADQYRRESRALAARLAGAEAIVEAARRYVEFAPAEGGQPRHSSYRALVALLASEAGGEGRGT